MSEKALHIRVPALTRVEGEGALELDVRGGRIDHLRLRIYEPPRFFEKFLEGRDHTEVPDMVARICGICPVAYQMSAVRALESIAGIEVPDWVRCMRRAMYCGEWVQSHALHIHMLAAPDFLGCDSVVELARKDAAAVRRGLALQALGNRIIELFGGRSVHPVGVCVGGFHRAPEPAAVAALVQELDGALAQAEALVHWCAQLPLSRGGDDFTAVAVDEGGAYPIMGERLRSSHGLDIDISEFERHFEERQVPYSTALHCLLEGKPYLVGPLARLNLCHDRLPEEVQRVLRATGIAWPSANMYHSIVARAVEILYALWEARRLLAGYGVPAQPRVPAPARAGTGFGCTEAPRGVLWHRYELDGAGAVAAARIVPPTSQNQARIEEDLRATLTVLGLEREADAIRRDAETIIRNYDPCISCATHFLRLELRREAATSRSPSAAPDGPTVIGIGSPAPGDDLGWRVIDALAAVPGLGSRVRLLKLDRPGPDLLRHLEGRGEVILVDALAGVPPGEAVWLEGARLAPEGAGPLSSHGLDPARVLALGRALGMEPRRLQVAGAAPPWSEATVARLVALLRRRLS